MRNDLISPSSRYADTDTATLLTADGRIVAYLRRRFVPPADRFQTIQEHVVIAGERLDNMTANFLGDPEQFWRLCDANGAMLPGELEQSGRRLRIALPEGITGPTRE